MGANFRQWGRGQTCRRLHSDLPARPRPVACGFACPLATWVVLVGACGAARAEGWVPGASFVTSQPAPPVGWRAPAVAGAADGTSRDTTSRAVSPDDPPGRISVSFTLVNRRAYVHLGNVSTADQAARTTEFTMALRVGGTTRLGFELPGSAVIEGGATHPTGRVIGGVERAGTAAGSAPATFDAAFSLSRNGGPFAPPDGASLSQPVLYYRFPPGDYTLVMRVELRPTAWQAPGNYVLSPRIHLDPVQTTSDPSTSRAAADVRNSHPRTVSSGEQEAARRSPAAAGGSDD